MTAVLRQWSLVYKRELGALLSLPLYYILCGIFFLLTSLIYLASLAEFARQAEGTTVNVTDSVIRPVFHVVHFFLLVQVPLLTMRIFSEDQQSGMLDLLQTTPMRDWPLLTGKFAAMVTAMAVYIVLTVSFPLATSFMGEVEWPVVAGSVLALLASASAYAAVGVFFSAVTESQVVAAVLSYVTLFLLVFLQVFAQAAGVPALADAALHFAVMEHLEAILSGNIAAMNVTYFAGLVAVFLFFTARRLSMRRARA